MSIDNTVAFNKDLNFFCGNGQWKNATKFETPLGVSYPTETKVLEVTGRGRITNAKLNYYNATGGYGFSAGDKLKIVVDDDTVNTYEWKQPQDQFGSSGVPLGINVVENTYSGGSYGNCVVQTPHKNTSYENWHILGMPFYTKKFEVYVQRKQRAGETQNKACTIEYTKDND